MRPVSRAVLQRSSRLSRCPSRAIVQRPHHQFPQCAAPRPGETSPLDAANRSLSDASTARGRSAPSPLRGTGDGAREAERHVASIDATPALPRGGRRSRSIHRHRRTLHRPRTCRAPSSRLPRASRRSRWPVVDGPSGFASASPRERNPVELAVPGGRVPHGRCPGHAVAVGRRERHEPVRVDDRPRDRSELLRVLRLGNVTIMTRSAGARGRKVAAPRYPRDFYEVSPSRVS